MCHTWEYYRPISLNQSVYLSWPWCHQKKKRGNPDKEMQFWDTKAAPPVFINDIESSLLKLFGWWFGTLYIFPYIGNNHPNWLIFFRGVGITNQLLIVCVRDFKNGEVLVDLCTSRKPPVSGKKLRHPAYMHDLHGSNVQTSGQMWGQLLRKLSFWQGHPHFDSCRPSSSARFSMSYPHDLWV